MDENEKSIFREKNLKKATDPEQLNRYIKVTGFSSWFVVIAAALILASIFIWAFFGKIKITIQGAGYCENGNIVCYFAQKDMKNLKPGEKVDIDGNEGKIIDLNSDLYLAYDIPNDVLFLLPEGDEWYSTASISCTLPDGFYSVEVLEKETRPISFLSGGN